MTGRARKWLAAVAVPAALWLAGCAELESQWRSEQVPGSDAAVASAAMARLAGDPMLS